MDPRRASAQNSICSETGGVDAPRPDGVGGETGVMFGVARVPAMR